MADIVFRRNGCDQVLAQENQALVKIIPDEQCSCALYGKDGTFCVVRDGQDAIASVGYTCYIDGGSMRETLSQILTSFTESKIDELKKKLVGQYVMLVKKGNKICVFSDFMGVRSVFYSYDGEVVSSSYSKVEELIRARSADLDYYKVLEFLAMRHVLYPTWIGRGTENKRIKWLLPHEYLVIDLASSSLRVGTIAYTIDNRKEKECSVLGSELVSSLRAILGRKEFDNSPVAASLTGGRDSRLVAAIAADQFKNIRYRTAASSETFTSLRDLEVAKKLSRVRKIPLDVYRFELGRDEDRFRELTEGFAPVYNHSITPLIDSASSYSLGFGGVYGTELFMPIVWQSIDDFVNGKVEGAKSVLKVETAFWNYFRESLYDEFTRIKQHYQLSKSDDRDYIRLLNLLDTARYSSFIVSAFNRQGYQLEPYGSYPVLELALRVAPSLWGNHRRLGGDALVQKSAMAKVNPQMGRVMTYSSFRPMLPLSITSAPFYLMGFTKHVGYWLGQKSQNVKKALLRTDLPEGYYLSDGWEKMFVARTVEKYGLLCCSPSNSSGIGSN